MTDGHEGILTALSALFPATPPQRCVIHKQRNVMNAIPKREQQEVATELSGIWKQATKEEALLNLAAFKAKYQKRYPEAVHSLMEDEAHVLTFYDFPQVMHRSLRTTNAIESFFSNVRQRTDQIDAFTRRYKLPDHRVGGHARYTSSQDPGRLIEQTSRHGK